MLTRRGFFRLLAGLGLGGLALGGYAGAVEPGLRLRVQRWQLSPPGWRGGPALRIALLADLHMGGPHMPLARLERVVETTLRLEPDLILLLGDYEATHPFNLAPVPIAETAGVLARLTAPLGVFAILGNHDWWYDRAAQARGAGPTVIGEALRVAGLRLLSNEAIRIAAPGGVFWLAGLEDQLALRRPGGFRGRDDLPGTLAQVTDDAPVLLMAHEPDIFPAVPGRVALTLCGHTHGGQVRLFGFSPVVPSRYGNRYAYGPVAEGGRHLLVSGGIGCSILPVRLGVPPEITLLELGPPVA